MARKQVAGQGTLDRFLSPSQDKQVQRRLAKSKSIVGTRNKDRQDLEAYKQGNTAVSLSAASNRSKSTEVEPPPSSTKQLQVGTKRAFKQMTRLYDEDEQASQEGADAECLGAAEPDVDCLSNQDYADFQPAKRSKAAARGKATRAGMHKKASKRPVIAGRAGAGVICNNVPTVSFQSFSYSKGDSEASKQHMRMDKDKEEVNSVQRLSRTRSKTTYGGLY